MKPSGTLVKYRSPYRSEKRNFKLISRWYRGYSQAHVRKILREKARRLERELETQWPTNIRWSF